MRLTSSQATALLRRHGLSSTRLARQTVASLASMGGPATAKMIHASLRRVPCDLATIHRILSKGERKGLLRALHLKGKSRWYELAAAGPHHHHLYCVRCRRVKRFLFCAIGRFEQAALREHGFEVESHSVELFGVCRACRNLRRNDK